MLPVTRAFLFFYYNANIYFTYYLTFRFRHWHPRIVVTKISTEAKYTITAKQHSTTALYANFLFIQGAIHRRRPHKIAKNWPPCPHWTLDNPTPLTADVFSCQPLFKYWTFMPCYFSTH